MTPDDPAGADERTLLRLPVARAVRVMGIATWIAITDYVAAPFVSSWARASTQLKVGIGLLLLAELVAMAGLVALPASWVGGIETRRRSFRWAVGTGVLLAISLLVVAPVRSGLYEANIWSPAYWTIPWMLWCFQLIHRSARVKMALALAAALSAVHLGMLPYLPHRSWQQEFQTFVWIVEPIAATTIFFEGLARAGQHRAVVLAQGLRAQAQQDRERAEARDRYEAERLLQDHLLHALLALGQDSKVPAEMVREECRATVRAIDQASDPSRLVNLADLVRADPAMTAANATVTDTARPAPAMAARAMAEATHEALENVAKHAHGTACEVTISSSHDHWLVSVVDDGVGFEVDSRVKQGSGLDTDVVGRLDDIGGSALVTSAPGQGTRVELRWPASDDDHGKYRQNEAAREMQRTMPMVAVPALLAGPAIAAIAAPAMAPPWLAALNSVVAMLVGLVYVHILRSRPMRRLDERVLLATVALSWTLHMALLPASPSLTLLWMSWQLSELVLLVVLMVPLVQGLTFTATWLLAQVVGVLLTRGVNRHTGQLALTLVVGNGELLVGMLGLALVRRLGSLQEQQRREVEQTRRVTANVHRGIELDQHWSHTVTASVLPTLRRVADGEIHPHEPALVADARRWAASVREELVLGPEQPKLLAALTQIRALGWDLSTPLGTVERPRERDHLVHLITLLGAPEVPGQMVTLQADDRRATAVVLDPTPLQLEDFAESLSLLHGDLVHDEGFARLTLHAPEL